MTLQAIRFERRALQGVVALAALVPVGAGLGGALAGAGIFDLSANPNADSHMRYLSGLLLGIGLTFFASIRHIENYPERFRILGGIVALGGMVRLLSALNHGTMSAVVAFSLSMELGVTPVLCAWQARVARIMRPQTAHGRN